MGKWDNNGDCNFSDSTKFSTDDLNKTIGGATPPIGSIVAWHPSLGGVPGTLPAGWVACNGQTLDDSESPLDGQTMPSLNSTLDTQSRYLRGASSSGGTGGGDCQNHTHNVSNYTKTAGDTNQKYIPTSYCTAKTVHPPYIKLRYIIRVK